jgi:multidrug efflux pump subunit AcrA (membrane-fusion protein)
MPSRRSIVGSAVDGRVVELQVNDGDRVVRGQTLAQLRVDTLRIEWNAASAELELRRQELAELENGSRPEEVTQAQAQQQSAKALAEYSKSKLTRTQALFRQGRSVSREELDQAVSSAAESEQSYLAAKAAFELVAAGPRRERIDQAKARVLVQQEVCNRITDQIEQHTILAPFDGYVVTENTEVGAWVSQGDPIAEVIQLDPVEIEVHVPGVHIVGLRIGDPAHVMINALPGQRHAGQVARIVPQADIRSRTFPVKIQVNNPRQDGEHLLKAGMLARVTPTTGNGELALMVPKDALVLGGAQPTIFIVETNASSGEATVQSVAVQSGAAHGTMVQIIGPVSAGQQVIVEGNERLRPGQSVQISGVLPAEEVITGAGAP